MQLITHKTGVGFNPLFLSEELPFPDGCTYLEANKDGLVYSQDKLSSLEDKKILRSLHLARVPFCEPRHIQQKFVANTIRELPSTVRSIGLHLCGAYREGLGLFGLGTGFIHTSETVESSRILLSLFRSQTNRQILIENANYYDHNPQQALATIRFTNQLCDEYGVRLILDLAHLIMNARNLRLDPNYLLGQVDLDCVEVVHLSGIVKGRDGVFHDGHTLPVYSEVWTLTETLLSLLTHPVTFVLEHTDPCWAHQQDVFIADWHHLNKLIEDMVAQPDRRQPIDLAQVGIGYMANIILPQHFPQIYNFLGKERFTQAARAWGQDFLPRIEMYSDAYVGIGDPDYLTSPIDPLADFVKFLKAASLRSVD